MNRNRRRGALSAEQQQLVRENLGLVGLHLKRRLSGDTARTDRGERPDLYQEGCLGLMQAAQDYDAGSGIPFAAYALRRIHRAIGYARERRFSLVRVPACELRRARREKQECGATSEWRADGDPRACSCSTQSACSSSNDRSAASPLSSPVRLSVSGSSIDPLRNVACDPANLVLGHGPTIAERLHERYLRAVGDAARAVASHRSRTRADEHAKVVDNGWLSEARTSPVHTHKHAKVGDVARLSPANRRPAREDQHRVIETIVAERLMIASPAWQTPLRKIAERLGCGYPAVAACERRLIKDVEQRLRRDENLAALLRCAATSPLGRQQPIDEAIERELRDASGTQFMRLLAEADDRGRSEILRTLLDIAGEALHPAICRTVSALPDDLRDQVLAEARASAAPREKKPHRQRTRRCA